MFVKEAKLRGMVISNYEKMSYDQGGVGAAASVEAGTYDSHNPYEILAQDAQEEELGAKSKRFPEI